MGFKMNDMYARRKKPQAEAPAQSQFMDDMYARRKAPGTPPPPQVDRHGPNDPHDYAKRVAREMQGWAPGDNREASKALLDKYRMQEEGQGAVSEIGVDHHKRGLRYYNEKNPLADYAAGVNQSLGGTGESLIGLYFPNTANRLRDAREALTGTPQGIAGTAGVVLGATGVVLASVGTGQAGGVIKGASTLKQLGFLGGKGKTAKELAARSIAITSGLFAQQGAGGSRMATAEHRGEAMHDPMTGKFLGYKEISGMDEFNAAFLTAVLEGGSGAASAGIASKMGQMFIGPQLRQALREGGKQSGITKAILLLTTAGLEGTEEGLTQKATNLVDMMYDITPGLQSNDGVLESAAMGAAIGPMASKMSQRGILQRAAAAMEGRPAVEGTLPHDHGLDGTAEEEAPLAHSPHEDRLGSQSPVRPNGPAHQQTRKMYVMGENEKALNRADRAIRKASGGDAAVEAALYKGLDVAAPSPGEQGYYSDILSRLRLMKLSKAKPKQIDSKQTVTAVAKALRTSDKPRIEVVKGDFKAEDGNDDFLYHVTTEEKAAKITQSGLKPDSGSTFSLTVDPADTKGKVFMTDRSGVQRWKDLIGDQTRKGEKPKLVVVRIAKGDVTGAQIDEKGTHDVGANSYSVDGPVSSMMSVDEAQVKAEAMVATVKKFTQNSVMGEAAAARHTRLTQRAINQGRNVPQAVLDEQNARHGPKDSTLKQTNKSIDTRDNTDDSDDSWDQDGWGSDHENLDGDDTGVDARLDPFDPENSHTWHVAKEEQDGPSKEGMLPHTHPDADQDYMPELYDLEDTTDYTEPDGEPGVTEAEVDELLLEPGEQPDGTIDDSEILEDEIDEYGDEFDPTGLSEDDMYDSYGAGAYSIVDANGKLIEGPYDTQAEADEALAAYQMEGGVYDGGSRRDRLDGWEPRSGDPTPPKPPADGGPADSDEGGPIPGDRNRPSALVQGSQDAMTPISSLMYAINPKMWGRMIKLEAVMRSETARAKRAVTAYTKAKNRLIFGRFHQIPGKRLLKGTAARDLNLAYDRADGNGETREVRRILKDLVMARPHGTHEEVVMMWKGYRNKQNELNRQLAERRAAGLNVGKRTRYHPRVVKDHKEWMKFHGTEERAKVQRKLDAEAKKNGVEGKLTDQQKNDVINDHLQGYGEQMRETSVRHEKLRTVDKITTENQHLYETGDVALMMYLARSVEATQNAKFFGKDNTGGSMEDNIGNFMRKEMEKGNMSQWEMDRMSDLIRSRFVGAQRSPWKGVRTLRDIGYLTVLANPFSAGTQLGDIILSVLSNGGISTAIGIAQALTPNITVRGRKILTRKSLSPAEFGIVQATAEMGQPGGLSNVLKWGLAGSGFTLIDTFGKTVNMNAAYHNFRKAAAGRDGEQIDGDGIVYLQDKPPTDEYKAMEAEWKHVLDAEWASTVSDLRNGVMSDNVRMMIFAQLSKTQPISLSEMPKLYLDNPNGRLFYMLKSFTLKQLDFAKKRSIDKIKKASATNDGKLMAEGMRGLTSYAFLFVAAGLGVDLLKEMLKGRPIDIDLVRDEAIDNTWKLVGAGKYTADSVLTEGPLGAFFQYMLPPTNIDDFVMAGVDAFNTEKDFDPKFMTGIPLVGRLAYYHLTESGGKTVLKQRKKSHSKARKRAEAEATLAMLNGSMNSARAIVNHYNDVRPDDMKRLSLKNIRNGIRREARKLREDKDGTTELREAFEQRKLQR